MNFPRLDSALLIHRLLLLCPDRSCKIRRCRGPPGVRPGGSRERKAKKTKEGRTVSTVFTRLLAAAERLLAIVRRSEGRPNKELGKLADQINAMCDKWED